MSEINGKLKGDLEKAFQTTSLIVLIQIFSSIGLIIFGWFFAGITDNSVSQTAISMLWATIVVLVIVSFVLRHLLFSRERIQKNLTNKILPLVLQNNTVFIGLIGIIITILGFLIATLSGNKFEILRAGAAALVVFLFNFPRKIIWQNIAAYLDKG